MVANPHTIRKSKSNNVWLWVLVAVLAIVLLLSAMDWVDKLNMALSSAALLGVLIGATLRCVGCFRDYRPWSLKYVVTHRGGQLQQTGQQGPFHNLHLSVGANRGQILVTPKYETQFAQVTLRLIHIPTRRGMWRELRQSLDWASRVGALKGMLKPPVRTLGGVLIPIGLIDCGANPFLASKDVNTWTFQYLDVVPVEKGKKFLIGFNIEAIAEWKGKIEFQKVEGGKARYIRRRIVIVGSEGYQSAV